MPDWSMNNWTTKKKGITFLEALGISSFKFKYPKFQPHLVQASSKSQHPIDVSTVGKGLSGNQNPLPQQKGAYQQYARKLLRHFGWEKQWDSFYALEMSEAGWNPKIFNGQGSGAFGIAQALDQKCGPATQGTMANEYCGQGLTTKQAKAANSGDGYWQLVWMMTYIKGRYGSPDAAWAFHQKHNWY